MTVATLDLATLKHAKNSVIGNPTAKRALARDDAFIGALVNCINDPTPYIDPSQCSQEDIRIETAHVIASLSYGTSNALKGLLSRNAHCAFLFAIANFQPTDSQSLRIAFARALRALARAIADAVGPPQGGLQIHASDARDEATVAFNTLFDQEALDIYLPLLNDSSLQICTSIAQLLSFTLRSQPYRTAVSDWSPLNERHKEVRGKRGWEKTEPVNSPSRQGGWVARQLVILLRQKDVKLQEAVLSAIGSLAQDNPSVASKLAKPTPEQPAVLSTVLALSKSRSTSMQLAASVCATSVIRAGISTHNLHHDPSAAMTVTHVLSSLIASETETPQTRTRACFILCQLVSDDKPLCKLVYERGALTKLSNLLKSITPTEPPSEWDVDEPETESTLREAALTAIACISMFDDDVRSDVTDKLLLIPYINISLTHRHIGVRYAACQCVRALSRAVSVLRTNIVDSGLGLAVYQLFRKPDEDLRVMLAASAVISNLVTDASPLRAVLVEQGVINRLTETLNKSEEPGLVLNSLWAFKNLLHQSSIELKRQVMNSVGWPHLASLLNSEEVRLKEQAFNLMRNLADDVESSEMVFEEIGSDILLNSISRGLDCEDNDVQSQAVYVLGNLANSPTHQQDILIHPHILTSLRSCLVDAKVEVRRPAVACVRELVRTNPSSYHELHAVGIDSTLRHMCEYNNPMLASSPTMRFSMGLQMGAEDDSEVKEKAREALHYMELGGELGI